MPALLPVAGTARLVCRGTALGQSIVNVFHVQNGQEFGIPYTQAGMTALVGAVATAYGTRFRPMLASTWSGDDVTGQDLSSITGVSYSAPITGNGTFAGTPTAQSAAACITWRINRHYRGGHPRTYIGPLSSLVLENATTFLATFITSLQAAANAFLGDINSLSADGIAQRLITVHRYRNSAQLDPPQKSNVEAGAVDTRLDTMRRRLGPDR